MKILVIGSGGREHALVWKLAQSPHIARLWCAPGNAGIAQEVFTNGRGQVQCVDIGAEQLPQLLEFAQRESIDLTVVGPDNPLALGIVDLFQQHGLRIWGPNRIAAQFESSKVFSQAFMDRHGIPTAKSGAFNEVRPALEFADRLEGRCAVKADGLALGKGVIICQNRSEAERAIRDMLERQLFGSASQRIVIQEYLEGIEVSLHALCDGHTALLFPTSQDHKQALDHDQGPNTGGMGTYCPTPFLDGPGMAKVQTEILDRWLNGCAEKLISYHGILYPGIIITRSGPKVLEFNARFGDPETQVYLMRLETDLLELLNASVDGTLRSMSIKWKPEAAVCVVMASGGYPGNYTKGHLISGVAELNEVPGVKVFHAGTKQLGPELVTHGGRVLGVTALGANLAAAQRKAYESVAQIRFAGAHFRRDIGSKALV
jgi:phosphoribosylamine---glycine ligase